MAEKRMFAKTIIDSDAFLDMPQSTQNLYFHMAMRADDDGFINNPKKISRMVGAGDDDIKVLISKRFIIVFESGIIVIKHWKIHNYIAKDRYRSTKYIEEFNQLQVNENGSYTECIQPVYELSTQSSLGKVSIDKVSIDIGENLQQGAVKNKTMHKTIEAVFLSKNNNSFDNYEKEGTGIKGIIEKSSKRDNPDIFIKNIIETFYNLIQEGNEFWKGQPFLPSALNSSSIFPRVEKQIKKDVDFSNLKIYNWSDK